MDKYAGHKPDDMADASFPNAFSTGDQYNIDAGDDLLSRMSECVSWEGPDGLHNIVPVNGGGVK